MFGRIFGYCQMILNKPSHRRKPVSSASTFLALHSLRSDSGFRRNYVLTLV